MSSSTTSCSTPRSTPRSTSTAPDAVRVAPYLTHIVTHHGQLTLTPPQNAGRIRRASKKRQPKPKSPDAEPRFNVAAPPSTSKRLNAPAARTRKRGQPPSTPASAHAQPHDLFLDGLDSPIPDYPPPSFQEAISTPSYSLSPSPLPSPQQFHTAARALSPRSDLSSSSLPSPSSSSEPLSPRDDPRTSPTDTDSSSLELLALEPSQRWEADRSLGLGLEERVVREYERQRTAESVSELHPAPTTPATPSQSARRCSHCGSVRPLDCADAHSIDDSSDERDAASMHTPSRNLFAHRNGRPANKYGATESAPSSPMAGSPTSFTNMSSPWTSSVTLSLGNVLSSHPLKRKESFGVRRLFSKGKEREASPPSDEALDTWEVVEGAEADFSSGRKSPSSFPSKPSPSQPSSSIKEKDWRAPPPSLAFVNRPLRQGPHSPFSPRSPGAISSLPPPPPPQRSPLRGPPATATSAPSDVKRARRAPPPPPPVSPTVVWRTTVSPPSNAHNVDVSHIPYRPEKPPIPTVIVRAPSQPLNSPRAAPRPAPRPPQMSASAPAFSNSITPQHGESALRALASTSELVPPSPNLSTRPTVSTSNAVSDAQTPTTPTSGHHYPGRPLPRPPPQDGVGAEAPARTEFSNVTDLDVFASRLDGRPENYEAFLLVSDVLGPARPPAAAGAGAGVPSLVGPIEQERRRVMKDGRVKLKLTLLGAVVDKCGICLSQFREAEIGALGAACPHSFHERCLRRWLATSRTCPLCRAAIALEPPLRA